MSRPELAEYCRAGFALVPIPHGRKGPVAKDWNNPAKLIREPELAEWIDGNIGLAHLESGTCCVDIDDMEAATGWFAERGIVVQELLDQPNAVMISSGRPNRAKLLYRIDKPLPSFKTSGLELRCASSKGTSLQDVLPPSIHPDTGKPYVWKYADELIGHWSILPELPPDVAKLWKDFAKQAPKLPRAPKSEALSTAPKKLVEILADEDPNSGYDDWVEVGMMLHHETKASPAGLALWDEWSAKGRTYKGVQDLETHWRSFRLDAENPVTAASFRRDKPAALDEFQALEETESEELALPAPKGKVSAAIRRDKNGKALAVLPNLQTILSVPDLCGMQLFQDAFKDTVMIAPAGTEQWRPLRDTDYTAVRLWLENTANFYPVARDLVRDAIHYIAEHNTVDTAQKWLHGLTWDGVRRIDTFMPRYMGTIQARYECAVGVYLWTALAGRVLEPGCQVDMVPILVGAGGIGKSQGVKALVPSQEFFTEIRLDEPDDVVARKMRGVLVGELAELRGLRSADADRIKAFVTRTHEQWIPKFKEFATTFPRRLVMVGTTNEDEFLTGDEGDRRWLPVRTVGVSVEAIKRDREQLWAEAREMWLLQGVSWHEVETIAGEARAEYNIEDQWEQPVAEWLAEHNPAQVRSHDLLVQAIGLDLRQVTRHHEQRVGKMLRHRGYERVSVRTDGKIVKVWRKQKGDPSL